MNDPTKIQRDTSRWTYSLIKKWKPDIPDVLGVYCGGEYLPSLVDGAPLAVGIVILESNLQSQDSDSRGSSVRFLSFGRTIDLVTNLQYACLSECLSFSIIDKPSHKHPTPRVYHRLPQPGINILKFFSEWVF